MASNLAEALGITEAPDSVDLILQILSIALEEAQVISKQGQKVLFNIPGKLEDHWADKLVLVSSKDDKNGIDKEKLKKYQADVDKWSKQLAEESVEKLTTAFNALEEKDKKDAGKLTDTAKNVLTKVLDRWHPDKQFPGYNFLTGYKKRLEAVATDAQVKKAVKEVVKSS